MKFLISLGINLIFLFIFWLAWQERIDATNEFITAIWTLTATFSFFCFSYHIKKDLGYFF